MPPKNLVLASGLISQMLWLTGLAIAATQEITTPPNAQADKVVVESLNGRQKTSLGPFAVTVDVKRTGRILVLDYALLDAQGERSQEHRDTKTPPQFTICQDGRQIGSGTFSYG
jgi:hypothetical protein